MILGRENFRGMQIKEVKILAVDMEVFIERQLLKSRSRSSKRQYSVNF